MSERSTIVACPNCGKKNRVRASQSGVPRCGVCHTLLPWIVEADRETFDDELKASVPVLVDFWAPWCGPCRMVSPLVERVGREHAGHLKVVKLNIDDAPEIADRYVVRGIPLLVQYRAGSEVARQVGAVRTHS
jgi:thioredoxin 2